MSGVLGWIRRFVRELRRRRVIRVAVVYAGTGFVILELADILQPALQLPSWTVRFIIVLLALGFPLAVGLAWVFDVTEEGLVRTEGGGEAPGELGSGGKPFTSNWVLISLLVMIAGLLLYPRVFPSREAPSGRAAPPTGKAVDSTRVVVFPFSVGGGEELDHLSEGMVELLGRSIGGAGGDSAHGRRACPPGDRGPDGRGDWTTLAAGRPDDLLGGGAEGLSGGTGGPSSGKPPCRNGGLLGGRGVGLDVCPGALPAEPRRRVEH